MKSIITLSAITGLAALALVGCNQTTPGTATDAPSTNAPAVNNVPDVNTNLPATNSVPNLNTNLAAGTNQ
jgi:hypothetical protein